jgi:hypothetical protein
VLLRIVLLVVLIALLVVLNVVLVVVRVAVLLIVEVDVPVYGVVLLEIVPLVAGLLSESVCEVDVDGCIPAFVVVPVVSVVVLSRRYQIMLFTSLTQLTLFGDIDAAVKPIMAITPFVDMIGYLPRPLKEAKPSKTLTSWPSLLIQKPSNVRGVKTVKFDFGLMLFSTETPLMLMLPVLAFAMPGTAAIFPTMEVPRVVELLIASCAASRSMSASGTVASTTTDPDSSSTITLAGSIIVPSVVDISAAIDC